MKSVLRKTICLLLSLVLVGAGCLQSFAAGEDRYISEVQIGYGDAGKKELQKNGFTVSSQDLNEDAGYNDNYGRQKSVWLGYKVTTDPDEAITDMAVMNMNGGYSFNAYEALLNQQKTEIEKTVESYMTPVKEFRENYKKQLPSAIKAYELMNLFYEDDSNQTLGDFFLDENTTKEQFETFFLQANATILGAVQRAIAVGLHDDDNNIFTKLEDKDIEDEDSYKGLAQVNRQIISDLSELQGFVKAYQQVDPSYRTSDEAFAAYVKANPDNLSSNELLDALKGRNIVDMTGNVEYAGAELPNREAATLLDILMMDEDSLYRDNYKYLNPLASCFTAGQRVCLTCLGASYMLTLESQGSDELIAEINDSFKDIDMSGEKISVYQGIDRDMFNPDGIALTDEAAKSSSNSSGSTWVGGDETKTEMAKKEAMTKLLVISTAFLAFDALVVGGFFLYAHSLIGAMHVVIAGQMCSLPTNMSALMSSYFFGVYGTAMTAFFAIVSIVAVICIAAILVYIFWANFGDTEDIRIDKDYSYTRKPRAMVSSEEDAVGKTYYAFYYAVKDTKGEIADLNGNDSKNPQWLCMYTTKDPRQGDPISEDLQFGTDGTIPRGYSGVHNFSKGSEGVKTAFNLNYGTAKNNQSHYMYVKHVQTAGAELAGSVFSQTSTLLTAISAFVLGGGAANIIMGLKNKKKKEQTA